VATVKRDREVEVIVVGLGHAGCEAALACARMGLLTLGVTFRRDRIAVMSCNPAIGGTAKGHLVRELDALGGEMGRVADATGTHFKILNESRGPAVRASRVLCDRNAYAAEMALALERQEGLQVVEGEVEAVLVESAVARGVRLADGRKLRSRAVILTTGTFLQALMHVGEQKEEGGRVGDAAARGLSQCLRDLGFQLGRFKTGTPARLRRDSIDYARCEPQPGEARPRPMSLRTGLEGEAGIRFPRMPQLSCHITYTTGETHRIVRRNLHRSPLYQGRIVGRGPRYCPSFEDKVVRFADRDRHQVFLEPEGPDADVVYPAGLSTSLPADVQLELLRSIPGLEAVEVLRYGYAVEYDFAPPTQLKPTLETRTAARLYFAGQLNGTSGYEEAAFQGFIAGVNAALAIRGQPELVLRRSEAHGAVLIDELVTRGVDEPFRMLTSRSEHRLRLREGNADLRLVAHGHRLGLVSAQAHRRTEQRRQLIDGEVARLKSAGLAEVLRRPEMTYERLAASDPDRPSLPQDVSEEVEVEVKYEGYIAQQDRAAARYGDSFDSWRIPDAIAFDRIQGFSAEVAEKLQRLRPRTVGQARRIPGVTPAALGLLLVHLHRASAALGKTVESATG
jgi:tRNA uridine 5-carboxymethylaminomethyl modification enzyme